MTPPLITHQGEDCLAFFRDYFTDEKQVRFIGTLGFGDSCTYFPLQLVTRPNIDFVFLIEIRPDVSDVLQEMAEKNREVLIDAMTAHGKTITFVDVQIVAEDTAVIAGRSAATACSSLMDAPYTDVIVDATSMSRGVCFPVVKTAYTRAEKDPSFNAHVVVAGRAESNISVTPMSSEAPEYMHGFRADMGVEDTGDAIKLWLPQLSEKNSHALNLIHEKLAPDEVSPILPFPSHDPLRGDRLIREYKTRVLEEWDVNLRDIIYAHESDPNDVYNTICRIHGTRQEAFKGAVTRPTRTILSPSGTRIGSLGMLFAALRLDLPVMYTDAMGYNSTMQTAPPLPENAPEYRWHIWLKH